jgi:hypothetical protein
VIGPVADLPDLLRATRPRLHDGVYACCVVPHDADTAGWSVVVKVAEAEGLTVVVPQAQAMQAGRASAGGPAHAVAGGGGDGSGAQAATTRIGLRMPSTLCPLRARLPT